MLLSWLNQSPQTSYWLVGTDLYKDAIAKTELAFNDALPLFDGQPFAEVMELTPWLVPMQAGLNEVPSAILEQGIGLQSKLDPWDALQHLRSLLFAALEGEEVMFRFYDKHVLQPMLPTFTQEEINQFLGGIEQIAVMNNEQIETYQNLAIEHYQLSLETWWKIQPHHLTPLYNLTNHTNILYSYYWQKVPKYMETLDNSNDFIYQILAKAQAKGFSPEKAEYCFLVCLLEKNNIEHEQVAKTLLLDSHDLAMLNELEKEIEQW